MARRPRTLRTQLAITITAIVALLTISMSVLSYFTTRHFLVVDEQHSLERQAFQQAALIQRELAARTNPSTAISHVDLESNQTAGLFFRGRWFLSGSLSASELASPAMRTTIAKGFNAVQTTQIQGTPHFVVGIPLRFTKSGYVLTSSLANLQHTLDVLFGALLSASLVIIAIGAGAGAFAARRSMMPLKEVSDTAKSIADGDLRARLPERPHDADLGGLSSSFNDMADRLADRIERDSRFASDVSHEMRSPLTSMIGALELVQRSSAQADATTQEAVALLSAEVHRFERLLQDLIELARLDSHRVTMLVDEVAVGDLIEQCLLSFLHHHPGEGAPRIMMSEAASNAVIAVDKRRFERVINNLLENASQYAGGATQIVVSQHSDPETITVAIIDRGPGIAADDLPHIFDRFYRGATSGSRRSGEGSGLGLAIVATQVTQLNGTIELSNNDPEPGVTALLCLPLLREPDRG